MTIIMCLKSYQLHWGSLSPVVPESWTLKLHVRLSELEEARRRLAGFDSELERQRAGLQRPFQKNKKKRMVTWNPAMGDKSTICKRVEDGKFGLENKIYGLRRSSKRWCDLM